MTEIDRFRISLMIIIVLLTTMHISSLWYIDISFSAKHTGLLLWNLAGVSDPYRVYHIGLGINLISFFCVASMLILVTFIRIKDKNEI